MKPNPFDELAKAMALSVTRRAAVKKFGFGLTTLALAALGLTNKAEARSPHPVIYCKNNRNCRNSMFCYITGTSYSPIGICSPYPSPLGGPCNITAHCEPGLVCRTYGGIPGGSCGIP